MSIAHRWMDIKTIQSKYVWVLHTDEWTLKQYKVMAFMAFVIVVELKQDVLGLHAHHF